MKILGIETSCDETAASIIEAKGDSIKVVSNVVSSQINIHRKYGGVVPEVAARDHIKNILPVIEQALAPLSPRKSDPGVKALAVTRGPGLIPALIVGLESAKALAYAWQKPLIGVNHMAGHIYSAWLEQKKLPQFPALILIVSGGHTELILMKGHYHFKKIGQTRDDAAGEAFDKVAKTLELGYPGGPSVATAATKITSSKTQIPKIVLPRPMMHDKNFDFSFSGLKTSVLYAVQKDKKWQQRLSEYCAEFQQAVIDVLIFKTLKAAEQYKVKSVILAGGVAANLELRKQLGNKIKTELPSVSFHLPHLKYTTDNAAMIAAAGYFYQQYEKKKNNITVDCNLTF
ncbi:MAG: tRNA (adenosine(37)-N6)-threonylcarbamoyltransferase complex transferase subunit TsaD [bacterium]|nr:tRNA (adenosine(37)-N6)-threonylcarbamoyltransferase complex transferase subunit TsaD [bacterium]